MGYYGMILSKRARKVCTVVLPWGLYEYLSMTMGIDMATDIFQARLAGLFSHLSHVLVYIDDIAIIGYSTYEELMKDVAEVLEIISKAGMQVNPLKCAWAQDKIDYPGFVLTQTGIKPQQKKISQILAIKSPTTKKALRQFVGMINYYIDIYDQRAHIMETLIAMVGKNTKWEWDERHEGAFQEMKRVMSQATLMIFPDFTKNVDVHTDASDYQMGA